MLVEKLDYKDFAVVELRKDECGAEPSGTA
jgi:hypothetical protein